MSENNKGTHFDLYQEYLAPLKMERDGDGWKKYSEEKKATRLYQAITKCPKCCTGTLSINTELGVHNCYSRCGFKGNFLTLENDILMLEKDMSKPTSPPNTPISRILSFETKPVLRQYNYSEPESYPESKIESVEIKLQNGTKLLITIQTVLVT